MILSDDLNVTSPSSVWTDPRVYDQLNDSELK